MRIQLSKFGDMLVSRESGREAFLAFQPTLSKWPEQEKLEIDFNGVDVFNPSWADEFITPLINKYGDKVVLLSSDNPSVVATLKLLNREVWKR